MSVMAGGTDVPAEADDTGQTVLGGGGQIASRSSEDLDPLAGAASVPVGEWPPSSWGPRLYEIDSSGNRAVSVALPGE